MPPHTGQPCPENSKAVAVSCEEGVNTKQVSHFGSNLQGRESVEPTQGEPMSCTIIDGLDTDKVVPRSRGSIRARSLFEGVGWRRRIVLIANQVRVKSDICSMKQTNISGAAGSGPAHADGGV